MCILEILPLGYIKGVRGCISFTSPVVELVIVNLLHVCVAGLMFLSLGSSAGGDILGSTLRILTCSVISEFRLHFLVSAPVI